MRRLNADEIKFISGAGNDGNVNNIGSSMSNWATGVGAIGAGIGASIATNSAAGAIRGGYAGAALGAAWGFGWGVGQAINNGIRAA